MKALLCSAEVFTNADEVHFAMMQFYMSRSVSTSCIGWSAPSIRACDFPVPGGPTKTMQVKVGRHFLKTTAEYEMYAVEVRYPGQ